MFTAAKTADPGALRSMPVDVQRLNGVRVIAFGAKMMLGQQLNRHTGLFRLPAPSGQFEENLSTLHSI
jgi:hypothetical protein